MDDYNTSIIVPAVNVPDDREACSKFWIDKLKYMLNQSEIPVSFEHGQFKTNEIVKILRGNLKGLIGQIRDIKNDMTEIWMSIDLLGGAVMNIKTSELEHL